MGYSGAPESLYKAVQLPKSKQMEFIDVFGKRGIGVAIEADCKDPD
jgi:hypothetical protein